MNRKTKKPLPQRICEALDFPVGALGSVSTFAGTGNRELMLCGCRGLVSYTGERVVLTMCDGGLTVTGRGLEVKSFTGGRISVTGSIETMTFGKDEGHAV